MRRESVRQSFDVLATRGFWSSLTYTILKRSDTHANASAPIASIWLPERLLQTLLAVGYKIIAAN